jgi:hypothetical protein
MTALVLGALLAIAIFGTRAIARRVRREHGSAL